MRVLVIEDEVRMARLIKRALEEEGHAVDIAGTGPDGLWMATENPYAAIILDVMLPGFDGFELCRRLREAGTWVPVLMLTARDEIGDRVRGLDAGADDYLVKPFSLLELAARLRALTRRDDRRRPAVLAEGDLKLDPASKRAWRGSTEIELSPKEFSLLEFFLRNPGTVLTRSQIIEAVWDFAYDGTSNVVDQYVKYLRGKVESRSAGTTSRPSAGWVTGCVRRAGVTMSIRLRLAAVFTAAAALVFALGSWLFVATLSASLLGSIDAQLSSLLSRASRYVPAASGRRRRDIAGAQPARHLASTWSRSSTRRAGSAAAARTRGAPR